MFKGYGNIEISKVKLFNFSGTEGLNSLLHKIDESCSIAKFSSVAVIGISEINLVNTSNDSEVAIAGYNLTQSNRNRKGGVVACYVRDKICFNMKTCLSSSIEKISLLI